MLNSPNHFSCILSYSELGRFFFLFFPARHFQTKRDKQFMCADHWDACDGAFSLTPLRHPIGALNYSANPQGLTSYVSFVQVAGYVFVWEVFIPDLSLVNARRVMWEINNWKKVKKTIAVDINSFTDKSSTFVKFALTNISFPNATKFLTSSQKWHTSTGNLNPVLNPDNYFLSRVTMKLATLKFQCVSEVKPMSSKLKSTFAYCQYWKGFFGKGCQHYE